MLPLALLMLVAPGASADVKTQSFVYGKYYSTSGAGGAKNTEANTYYAFTPSGHDAARDGKLPVVVEIHGGGFTGGSATRTPTAQIASAVANGIAWISVDYRLVATKYYYGSGSTEELIHVDAAGRLTLDTAGKTMDDYEIRRGRTEYNTKCSYDTVQFLGHCDAKCSTCLHEVAVLRARGEPACPPIAYRGGSLAQQQCTCVSHSSSVGTKERPDRGGCATCVPQDFTPWKG